NGCERRKLVVNIFAAPAENPGYASLPARRRGDAYFCFPGGLRSKPARWKRRVPRRRYSLFQESSKTTLGVTAINCCRKLRRDAQSRRFRKAPLSLGNRVWRRRATDFVRIEL